MPFGMYLYGWWLVSVMRKAKNGDVSVFILPTDCTKNSVSRDPSPRDDQGRGFFEGRGLEAETRVQERTVPHALVVRVCREGRVAFRGEHFWKCHEVVARSSKGDRALRERVEPVHDEVFTIRRRRASRLVPQVRKIERALASERVEKGHDLFTADLRVDREALHGLDLHDDEGSCPELRPRRRVASSRRRERACERRRRPPNQRVRPLSAPAAARSRVHFVRCRVRARRRGPPPRATSST
jgi:hypothetical protein